MSTEQIVAALAAIGDRIEACFDQDADKYTADKHATLEQVGDSINALITRIQESRS
jgi:hypothetical protein